MLIGATALSVIVALVLVGAGMRRQTTTSTTYAADGRVLSSEGTGSLQLYGMVLLRSDDPTTFFPQLSNLAIFSVLGLAVLLFGGTAFTVVFLRRRPKGHTPIQHALRHTPKQIPAIAKDEGAGNKGAAAAEEGSYIPKPGRLRMEDFAATGPIRVVGGAIIGFVMGIAIGLLFWFVMARTSGIQMSADMAFVMPLLGGLGGMLMCPLAAVCAVKSRALSAKNRAQRKHKPKAEALSAKPGSS